MAKVYFDNYKLLAARASIFEKLDVSNSKNIHDIMKLVSGDFLPKKDIEPGHCKVYGGGGFSNEYHKNSNVKKTTLGIGRVGARCGCVFEIEPDSWVTDNALFASQIFGEYNIGYLIHWLNYVNLNQYANTSAQPVISLKRISTINIPSISLEQQEKISEILNQIEHGKEITFIEDHWGIHTKIKLVENIELFVKESESQTLNLIKLRQAILQEAIEGKLTVDWRKENHFRKGDPDFDAEALLEKIQAEKEKLIKKGKIKKQKPLAPIKAEEVPFELPEGWVWTRLGEVCSKITDGTHHSPVNTDQGEYKYVTAKNIKYDGIDLSNISYVTEAVHNEIYSRCNVEYGDVLYIKDGATTGIVTINNLSEQFSMLSSVALLKPLILNFYLALSMRSPFFYEETRAQMYGVAITRVTLEKIINALVPLPPLAEQQAIVDRVEKLLSMVDELEKQVSERKEQSEQLMQAVLREAFEGKA